MKKGMKYKKEVDISERIAKFYVHKRGIQNWRKTMVKVILFSPRGYVGGYLKETLLKRKDVLLYEITRESNLESFEGDFDVFIYSASITALRKEENQKYIRDNAMTASTMIEFCKLHNIKRIIYLSSDEIYGNINTSVVGEKAIMVEPNIYALTKYLAEKMIIESGIPYYILRLPAVVGRKWGNTFIYRLMERVEQNQKLYMYNTDKDFNNLVDIEDLVRFIVLLAFMDDLKGNDIFLLGNCKKIKLREMVEYIKSMYHSESEIYDITKGDERYFTLDVTKAVNFGYQSKNIRNILRELYQLRGCCNEK